MTGSIWRKGGSESVGKRSVCRRILQTLCFLLKWSGLHWMHPNNNKAVFFWHVSSLVEAFNQSRKCIESIVTNIITFTLIHLGYCWSMLYSYYKEQFANILDGNNYLGLLSKLTQHQICKLAILENRRPRTWSHLRINKFSCRFISERIP